jgi:hypothetical protein
MNYLDEFDVSFSEEQTITISDAEAVTFTKQKLTEEQKSQARENIGAVSYGALQEAIDPVAEAMPTNYVAYRFAQNLDDEFKAQARENIGAIGEDDIPASEFVVQEVPTITVKIGGKLLTDDIVTLGAGWSGNLTDGFTHVTGKTEPLTFDIGSVDGEKYAVAAQFTGKPASVLSLTIGDSFPTDPYGSNPWFWGVQSVGGGSLKITPASTWAGTITAVDCRKIIDDGEYELSFEVNNIKHSSVYEGVTQEGMPNHLSGFWDIQIGVNALKSSVNTTRCIAIGKESLCDLQSGGRNIGLGTFTLPRMKYGEDNIAIGADAGLSAIEAHGSIAIGKSAMSVGNKYTDCVAIGHAALYGSADGETSNNVGIGKQAGYRAKGNSNVFIGSTAGYKHTSTGNVFIGANAGVFPEGTDPKITESNGTYNTVIGYNSKIAPDKSKSVAIGVNATVTANNQVVLGGDHITQTLLKGDLIIRATDGTKKQIVFNPDGTIGWTEVE